MKIKKMSEEFEVLRLLMMLHETEINDYNKETISSDIERQILNYPLADSWTDYLLLNDSEVNINLKSLIAYHRRNLLQVIDGKYQEELERIRPSFDKKFDSEPTKRY